MGLLTPSKVPFHLIVTSHPLLLYSTLHFTALSTSPPPPSTVVLILLAL